MIPSMQDWVTSHFPSRKHNIFKDISTFFAEWLLVCKTMDEISWCQALTPDRWPHTTPQKDIIFLCWHCYHKEMRFPCHFLVPCWWVMEMAWINTCLWRLSSSTSRVCRKRCLSLSSFWALRRASLLSLTSVCTVSSWNAPQNSSTSVSQTHIFA